MNMHRIYTHEDITVVFTSHERHAIYIKINFQFKIKKMTKYKKLSIFQHKNVYYSSIRKIIPFLLQRSVALEKESVLLIEISEISPPIITFIIIYTINYTIILKKQTSYHTSNHGDNFIGCFLLTIFSSFSSLCVDIMMLAYINRFIGINK